MTTTLSDLAFRYDELLFDTTVCPHRPRAKGFTIGNGKKLYWYLRPMPSGYYKVYALEDDGTLSWPRQIEASQEVTIHY